MLQTDPYVRDLHMTAATVVTNYIRASWCGSGEALPYAVVEAGLDAATPFLEDAARIGDVILAGQQPTAYSQCREPNELWVQVEGDPHRYLELLYREGRLQLRTLRLADDPLAS